MGLPYAMRPGVHANVVTGHILLKQDLGALNDTRADDEEGRVELVLVEVLEDLAR